ncbi:DUF6183 family protein [Streptomyces sp. NPDC102394]|uniref:DUF6183 family protein n=1 Tax=Streptomyces sp. NPDC102394 TaxID=3366167 RepID=UPI00380BD40E
MYARCPAGGPARHRFSRPCDYSPASTSQRPGATHADVFDRLLRLLALTPGQDHAASAERLVTAAPDNGMLARYAASLLVDGQAPRDLKFAFASSSSSADALDELRCCLVQELVLRGVPIAENPENRSLGDLAVDGQPIPPRCSRNSPGGGRSSGRAPLVMRGPTGQSCQSSCGSGMPMERA